MTGRNGVLPGTVTGLDEPDRAEIDRRKKAIEEAKTARLNRRNPDRETPDDRVPVEELDAIVAPVDSARTRSRLGASPSIRCSACGEPFTLPERTAKTRGKPRTRCPKCQKSHATCAKARPVESAPPAGHVCPAGSDGDRMVARPVESAPPAAVDPELSAIAAALAALEGLEPAARLRALGYVTSRLYAPKGGAS